MDCVNGLVQTASYDVISIALVLEKGMIRFSFV